MADVTVTSPDRQIKLAFARLHRVRGCQVSVFWSGAVASNGDGKPEGAVVDYATPIAGPITVWPAGRQAGFLNGPFLSGGFLSGGARQGNGFGFLTGRFLEGGFLGPAGRCSIQVPSVLRNGDYTFGMKLLDKLGNAAATEAEITVSVEAIPRPAARARIDSYDSGNEVLNIGWTASPDLLD